MGEPLADRAPILLRSLGLVEPSCDPSAMTVGHCDVMLFDLRRWLFGPDLDLVATCPLCQDVVELVIPTADIVPPRPTSQLNSTIVEIDGLRIRCRVPTNRDFRELAARGPDATIGDLLERCVEAVEGSDDTLVVSALSTQVSERLAEAMAHSDPGADITVEIECPCGAEWPETVDIRSILWTELTRWVHARLFEVQQLARSFGWSERDILDMSPYRRRLYLESCG
jgi:hypothetical protein